MLKKLTNSRRLEALTKGKVKAKIVLKNPTSLFNGYNFSLGFINNWTIDYVPERRLRWNKNVSIEEFYDSKFSITEYVKDNIIDTGIKPLLIFPEVAPKITKVSKPDIDIHFNLGDNPQETIKAMETFFITKGEDQYIFLNFLIHIANKYKDFFVEEADPSNTRAMAGYGKNMPSIRIKYGQLLLLEVNKFKEKYDNHQTPIILSRESIILYYLDKIIMKPAERLALSYLITTKMNDVKPGLAAELVTPLLQEGEPLAPSVNNKKDIPQRIPRGPSAPLANNTYSNTLEPSAPTANITNGIPYMEPSSEENNSNEDPTHPAAGTGLRLIPNNYPKVSDPSLVPNNKKIPTLYIPNGLNKLNSTSPPFRLRTEFKPNGIKLGGGNTRRYKRKGRKTCRR